MPTRRGFLQLGFAVGSSSAISGKAAAELIAPDGLVPSVVAQPSPPTTPFADSLYIMPIAQPVDVSELIPAPDPARHQRYDELEPQKFYVEEINEFTWQYHSDPPYNQGSWGWGFNGLVPGATYIAHYGEPVLVRRINRLPSLQETRVKFALPSPSIHLHNAHTASESDGFPTDFFNPGEFWDHHYGNFPAGHDPREKLTTLWYHDHRMDFTAPNVYAGLAGFYLLFDENDTGDENDTRPSAWRLPSGDYDIPLMLHDVQFDENGQVVWDFFNREPVFTTVNGMLGDKITVNRKIQPYLDVEPRKYRFRILNGGPSRFYDLHMQPQPGADSEELNFTVVTTDGNFLRHPIVLSNLEVAVAQRYDVIVDFSAFKPGDEIILFNQLEMRPDGAGPSGRKLDNAVENAVIKFNIGALKSADNSRIPEFFRDFPPINMSEVVRERLFVFDSDNGLWTINGRLMDPNRIDMAFEQGTAEVWTFRNAGAGWAHPVHSHFEECMVIEKNGEPVDLDSVHGGRKDMLVLGPNDEIKLFIRERDFLGKYVMHCHNVVHEDHAMMIRWDIVEPGQGY
ncbi:Spore coat protein A [BD1-7 clade bacterium]|uniref:Multicopper oxidase CueO n=1 Tax=BD1-7 clade bacterium TaxID=2029982 RepID=A0A5S9P042_9GAMM|nr:Spore coat protein A [BD1-7 clade bacterium]CAA0115825.1 Spore coat protein A [BD1-7 clade bacterium]CAA0119502.1 Spore coat protein A [BD1-7 clade bacterium]